MKRFIIGALALIGGLCFAQERVVFDSSVAADFEGFNFVQNFEVIPSSGYFTNKDLVILEPNEKGIRVMAMNVPQYSNSSYLVRVPYNALLNDAEGAGKVENVGAIKSISVNLAYNRVYDSISLLYQTGPFSELHEIKMPQNSESLRSMQETTLVFDNPLYEPDVAKRDIKINSVLDKDGTGFYLYGIKVTCHQAAGVFKYSPYSILYLKNITLIADKAYTDEQLEEQNAIKESFGINERASVEAKAREKLQLKTDSRENQKALMVEDSKE